MILIKNEEQYTVYVEYSLNSGHFTVQSVEVLAKNDPEIDCTKIAEKIFKKYKKDAKVFFKDIQEYGDVLQRSQVLN